MNAMTTEPNHRDCSPVEALVSVLSSLIGQCVTRVSIEPWAVRLTFETAELTVECDWRLLDDKNIVRDMSQQLSERREFRLWRLAKETVTLITITEQQLPILSLSFTGGWTLVVPANDDGYEDWSCVAVDKSFWIVCNKCLEAGRRRWVKGTIPHLVKLATACARRRAENVPPIVMQDRSIADAIVHAAMRGSTAVSPLEPYDLRDDGGYAYDIVLDPPAHPADRGQIKPYGHFDEAFGAFMQNAATRIWACMVISAVSPFCTYIIQRQERLGLAPNCGALWRNYLVSPPDCLAGRFSRNCRHARLYCSSCYWPQ